MHLHQNLIQWSWWVRTYLFLIAIQIWNQRMSKMEPKHGIGVAFHFTCPLHIVVWQGNKRMHIYNCCWKKRDCIFPAWIILLYIHSRGVGLIERGRIKVWWWVRIPTSYSHLPLDNNLFSPPPPPPPPSYDGNNVCFWNFFFLFP